jgi:hypothetical protein
MSTRHRFQRSPEEGVPLRQIGVVTNHSLVHPHTLPNWLHLGSPKVKYCGIDDLQSAI